MEMTKEEVKMAIDFLETIPNEDFIADEQTLGFKAENIGKKHCVYGHLAVNPKSPFFNEPEEYNIESHLMDPGTAKHVAKISYLNGAAAQEVCLTHINNRASDENCKSEVLEKLTEYYNSLV